MSMLFHLKQTWSLELNLIKNCLNFVENRNMLLLKQIKLMSPFRSVLCFDMDHSCREAFSIHK